MSTFRAINAENTTYHSEEKDRFVAQDPQEPTQEQDDWRPGNLYPSLERDFNTGTPSLCFVDLGSKNDVYLWWFNFLLGLNFIFFCSWVW